MFDVRTYEPAGPVLRRFHESEAFYRVVAGPVGSGKTYGCGCAEMTLGVMVQRPMPDGVRRAKFGVLRDTYRNLYSQFIPSWFEMYPRELGRFVGSDDRPAMHEFRIDGLPIFGANGQVTGYGPCELQVEMRALGTNSVESTCRGWNLTGVFLDEADLMPEEAFSFLTGRVKRWPHKDFRVTKGVWATFNKPDEDHYLYRWCLEEKPENFEFFDQPGGLLPGGPPYTTNPKAENLERLDDDYYDLQAKNNPEWYVRRMVRNEWGASVSGEVIYPEFRPDLHVSPVELVPPAGSTLWIGADGGGTPAAVIGGRDDYGRRIIYGEVVLVDPADPKGKRLLTGVGPQRFYEAIRDNLAPRFQGCTVVMGWGDPAAFYGADREYGEFSFMEKIGLELGVPMQPAESNEIHLRLEAVRHLMTTLAHDGRPSLIINPSCRWLRRGFMSDYKYEQRDPKQPGKALKPQKTATSHVHDALQYFCLGQVGRVGVTAGRAYDRFQPKRGVGPQSGPTGPNQPWTEGIPGAARGTHYEMNFNPWK